MSKEEPPSTYNVTNSAELQSPIRRRRRKEEEHHEVFLELPLLAFMNTTHHTHLNVFVINIV